MNLLMLKRQKTEEMMRKGRAWMIMACLCFLNCAEHREVVIRRFVLQSGLKRETAAGCSLRMDEQER